MLLLLTHRLASVISVYLAHKHLGRLFAKHWRTIVFWQGILEAMAVQKLLLRRKALVAPSSVAYFLARTALWKVRHVSHRRCCTAPHVTAAPRATPLCNG